LSLNYSGQMALRHCDIARDLPLTNLSSGKWRTKEDTKRNRQREVKRGRYKLAKRRNQSYAKKQNTINDDNAA